MKKDFFQVVSVSEFTGLLQALASLTDTEEIPLNQAIGRIPARSYQAAEDLPAFDRSSMDGYALMARDSFGASEINPVYLKLTGDVGIEALPEAGLESGQCMSIVTGAGLPQGADSVVMVEHTDEFGPDEIEVRKAVAPGENVMHTGEDVARGETLVQQGIRLKPQHLGLLAALGIQRVQAVRQPLVGIVSTGDELVAPGQDPGPGQIRDVNSTTLEAMTRQFGGRPHSYGIVRDDAAELRSALSRAVQECDLVFISGGSSIGTRDLTLECLQEQGEVLAHGVAMSPGKPTILARVGATPVLGLPGQVTSAQVVVQILAGPCIAHLAGQGSAFSLADRPHLAAILERNLPSKQGREDYVRVRCRQDGETLVASPLFGKSGLLRTLVQAQGLVRIPAESEGLLQGREVRVLLI
jgi:molybdopterin molybdotransferase